jgi:hypothetical protein
MSGAEHAVLLCDSIHDVLSAERAVKQAGLWCDMVPAPRELSSDCGMVLQVRRVDLPTAQVAVTQAGVPFTGWYAQISAGYQRVSSANS